MDSNELIVREHYDLLTAISNCEKQKKEIEKQEKAMREHLLKAMEDHKVWDLDLIDLGLSITRVARPRRTGSIPTASRRTCRSSQKSTRRPSP